MAIDSDQYDEKSEIKSRRKESSKPSFMKKQKHLVMEYRQGLFQCTWKRQIQIWIAW